MKKITLLLLLTQFCFSQDKLHFKSIAYGIGPYQDEYKTMSFGLNANLELATSYQSNIFAVNMVTGLGFTRKDATFDNLVQAYLEFDLLYGREFHLSNSIAIEAMTGGSFIGQSHVFGDKSGNAFGVPVRLKFRFLADKRVSFGLNPNANFNNVRSIYNLQLFLQYRFSK